MTGGYALAAALLLTEVLVVDAPVTLHPCFYSVCLPLCRRTAALLPRQVGACTEILRPRLLVA